MQPLKVEGYIYINISSTFMYVRPGLAALPPVPISKIHRINSFKGLTTLSLSTTPEGLEGPRAADTF